MRLLQKGLWWSQISTCWGRFVVHAKRKRCLASLLILCCPKRSFFSASSSLFGELEAPFVFRLPIGRAHAACDC